MKADDGIMSERANWTFAGEVATHFDSHVKKSIPGYDEGHKIVTSLSDFFCIPDSLCYELGTSTGALLQQVASQNAHKSNVRFVGIDVESDMVTLARKRCESLSAVEIIEDDLRLHPYEKADLFISYYVLQFVAPRDRQQMLDTIYDRLNWGGAFIWFEKVRGPDARFQDILVNLYNNFKASNGFSSEEILNKTESLKGVMEPFSSDGNRDMLKRAGFKDIMTIYRNLCFEGVLCIK